MKTLSRESRLDPLLWFLCVTWFAVSGCSGSSPTAPSPTPQPTPTPSRITVSGTLTDTLTGAAIGSFSDEVPSLPAFVTVSANGFLTRKAWITSPTPAVDLIRDAAPFDLGFYRQLARGSLDGHTDPLHVWSQAPSIYLQRTGLSDATVASLEQVARATVPALTGGRYGVQVWETGQDRRSAQRGWIVVSLKLDPAPGCGESVVGGGDITLNTKPICVLARTFAHEIGHSLGFWHVTDASQLMHSPSGADQPTTLERHHAAVAYHRSAGNRDVDEDAQGGSGLIMSRVVVD